MVNDEMIIFDYILYELENIIKEKVIMNVINYMIKIIS